MYTFIHPKELISYKINDFKYDKKTTKLTLDCDIVFKGNLLTYDFETCNVTVRITKTEMELIGIDYPFFLSDEAQEFYTDQFLDNGKAEDIYWVDDDELFNELDEFDIDLDKVKNGIIQVLILNNKDWQFYTKDFTLHKYNDYDDYVLDIEFVNPTITDFWNKYINGETIFYKVYKDREEIGSFEKLEDAKEFVKTTIIENEIISKENHEALLKYSIESWSWYIRNEENPDDIGYTYIDGNMYNAYYDTRLKKELKVYDI